VHISGSIVLKSDDVRGGRKAKAVMVGYHAGIEVSAWVKIN